MYPTGFVSKRITGPKVSSSDGLRLFQSYLISFLCLSESWARRSTYVVSAESWGSSWTFWELWGPFIVFIVVHRKSSHHWPRRKHTVSKLHMWYTPLKKCYQAMWAWSFRQTVISVWQAKSLQPREYRLMMYHFVYNYIQLHTITYINKQLHTITYNYTQLHTITYNY